MFDDHFGLTQAVLEGRKTQTRRLVGNFAPIVSEVRLQVNGYLQEKHGQVWFPCGWRRQPKYNPGEVVAVAQSYKDAGISFIPCIDPQWGCTRDMPGYNNKMFVRADLMPHQVRITSVRIARLQDISNEDCMREGVRKLESDGCPIMFTFDGWSFKNKVNRCTDSPKEAFEALFKKLSGKKAWDDNPWVFVYEFELVK